MRIARVLLVALHNPADPAMDPGERVEINRSNVSRLLEVAADYDPDVVCFPETTIHHGAIRDGIVADVAEPIPGPSTKAVGDHARALDAYVSFGLFERDGEDLFNAAPLVGPDGSVVGTYRKVAPIGAAMDQGVRPGTTIPVWETPVGRIGTCICWDARYPEVGATLGRQGADLVLRPTLGNERRQLGTWALYDGYHIANCDKNGACFYRPSGQAFGGAVDAWNTPSVDDVDLQGGSARLSFAELNTDCAVYQRGSWVGDALRDYPGSLVYEEAVDDGMVVLTSIAPDLSLADVEREYDAEPMRVYRERTRDRIVATNPDSPIHDLRPTDRGTPRNRP